MRAAVHKEMIVAVHKGFPARMSTTVLFIMVKNGRNLEVHPSGIREVSGPCPELQP